MAKGPGFADSLPQISPLTSISIPHFTVFIYLQLRGDPEVPEGDVKRFSSEEGLGKNPYFMPNGIWKTVELSVGKFLARSINRELEGGRQAFAFPSDLKLSAPPAHHLQDRSSECNRPFILMTLFYWCRNGSRERKAMCQGHRVSSRCSQPETTLSATPLLPLGQAARACDKEDFG